jgi:hypothetical protein
LHFYVPLLNWCAPYAAAGINLPRLERSHLLALRECKADAKAGAPGMPIRRLLKMNYLREKLAGRSTPLQRRKACAAA